MANLDLADATASVADGPGGAGGSSAGAAAARAEVVRRTGQLIDMLIAHGADVNAKNVRGVTPLHLAAWDATRGLAEGLIAKGANVNPQDARGKTPLAIANERHQKDAAALLTQAGGKE
jgi:ankyrin repeat protein